MSIGRSTYVLWENEVSKLEASQTDALRGRVKKARAELEAEMKRSPGWTSNLATKLDGILSVLGEPLDFTSAAELGSRSGQSLLKQELEFKGWPAEAMMADFTPAPPIRAASYINLKSTELIKETASDLKAKILDEVSKGLLLGQGTTAIMDRVLGTGLQGLAGRGGAFRGAGFRAEAIARTTVNEAFNAAANSVYEEVGSTFPDLNLKREWVSQVDNRTSQRCKSLDGKVVGQGELFVAGDGWTGLLPPAHPFCRSRVVAVVDKAPDNPAPLIPQTANIKGNSFPIVPDDRANTTTDLANKWEGSWKGSPSPLKRLVRQLPPPNEVPPVMVPDGAVAFHWLGRIYMSPNLKPGDHRGYAATVYRHEYGHYADQLLPGILTKSFIKKELATLGFKGGISELSSKILSTGKKNPEEFDRLVDIQRKLYSKFNVGLFQSDDKATEIIRDALFQYEPDNKSRYISSTIPFAKAMRTDEAALYTKGVVGIPDNYEDLLDKYKDVGYIKAIAAVGSKEQIASSLIATDKLTTFEENVRKRLEERGSTASQSAISKKVRELIIKKIPLDGDHTSHKLWNGLSDEQRGRVSRYWLAEMLVNPESPLVTIKLAEVALSSGRAHGISPAHYGMVSDLSGSLTANKVGLGHSDDYYNKGGQAIQNTEVFANIVSIYGSGHPLAVEVLNYFVPNTFRELKNVLGAK